jgi:hypothetical protein
LNSYNKTVANFIDFREMFIRTIQVAKETRPKAKWTYWDCKFINLALKENI